MSITITRVRNASSLSPENNTFNVEIHHPDYGWIPYSLTPDDEDTVINNNVLRTLIGSDFKSYVAPTQAELDAQAASEARDSRAELLVTEVDPIVTNPMRWGSLSSVKQNEWTQYRTALLDVPQQSGFPNSITWPSTPA